MSVHPQIIRRRRTVAAVATLIVVTIVAYLVLVITAPEPTLNPSASTTYPQTFEITEVEYPWPTEPAAIAVWNSDAVRANSAIEPVNMASLVKVIAILVSLDAKPFDAQDQSTYTLTQKDAAHVAEVLRFDGATERVVAGVQLTRYQLIQLMMLPSANNYALSYVDWMFGSNEAFVSAANEYLAKHGLEAITVTEPTGLYPGNTGTAADLAQVAKLALDEPVLAEIMAQRTADIPGIGTITSTNSLLGDSGIRGLKTGSTTDGKNLLLVRDVTVADRTVTFVIATLAQPTSASRIAVNRMLAESLSANVQELGVVAAGDSVGSVTLWDGQRVSLETTGSASTVLTLDESSTRTVSLRPVTAGTPAGAVVGEVTVNSPTGSSSVDVVLTQPVPTPDLWWRLTHPIELWGGRS